MTLNSIAESFVRTYGNLSDLYDDSVLEYQRTRYSSLKQKFYQRYNRNPDFIVRSPGRVNLIGEHIDYALYSVLPMAIDRDVIMAIASVDSDRPTVTISNVNSSYPDNQFDHDSEKIVDIDSSIHEWSNYFKCGYKGVFEKLKMKSTKSLMILMDGTVPLGGGLSSSAAFVCCSALGTMVANEKSFTMGELTQVAIASERYAGVHSGGMDQSISIMAPAGSPLIIHFYPQLFVEPVLFQNVSPVFVIANTLVTAEKHLTAPTNYNLRVVEVRLAATLLAKKLGLIQDIPLITLREVQDLFKKARGLDSLSDIDILSLLLEELDKFIQVKGYTREEIARELEMSVDAMESHFVGPIVIKADAFDLYNRAKHVFSEARRVYMFKKVAESSSKDMLEKLGDLMNASQESCRDLFNCSCPALDEMTSLALKYGAYGSRLTGAGWGGCTVSLVEANKIDEFISSIKREYYQKKLPGVKINDPILDEYIFSSKPGSGCGIFRNLNL